MTSIEFVKSAFLVERKVPVYLGFIISASIFFYAVLGDIYEYEVVLAFIFGPLLIVYALLASIQLCETVLFDRVEVLGVPLTISNMRVPFGHGVSFLFGAGLIGAAISFILFIVLLIFGSDVLLDSISGGLGFLLFWGVVILLAHIIAVVAYTWYRQALKQRFKEMADLLTSSKIDYYYIQRLGVYYESFIAVDVSRRVIFTHCVHSRTAGEVKLIDVDEVVEWITYDPGTKKSTKSIAGGTGAVGAAVAVGMVASNVIGDTLDHIDRLNETGLYLRIKDPSKPMIFTKMSYESAQSWSNLLKQLSEQTLQNKSLPTPVQG